MSAFQKPSVEFVVSKMCVEVALWLLGQGAANTEAKLFAGLLEENAGLGPKLSWGPSCARAQVGPGLGPKPGYGIHRDP